MRCSGVLFHLVALLPDLTPWVEEYALMFTDLSFSAKLPLLFTLDNHATSECVRRSTAAGDCGHSPSLGPQAMISQLHLQSRLHGQDD